MRWRLAPFSDVPFVSPGETRCWAIIVCIQRDSLTVALDATYAAGGGLTGVGVYSREILYGLAHAHPESRFLYCYRPHRLLKSFSEGQPSNARRRLLSYSKPPRASLFHALNQRVEYAAKSLPTVVTFHDLFVLSGEYSSPEFRDRFARQAREAAERADLIIAVSRFTGDQVRDLLKVPESRIRVIPHGTRAPVDFVADDAARENIILHVGAIQKRKNLLRLIEAFEALKGASPWRLVLAGSASGWQSEDVLSRIAASPSKKQIQMTGYIDDDALEDLYRRARIFAFPSLDEGFGIPVIEAQARGVPVLTSNRSGLPEAAGGAALLVDPSDTTAIAEGLQSLATDAQLRNELRIRGLARAASATWERAVEQTWAVYQELLR
jgi:glycosyltransferase involved in cell wall biosynthesis